MKILFVSGNLCDGGAQRVISVTASALAEKGHDVSVLLFSRNEKEYPLSEKVKIFSLAQNFEEYSKISGLKRIFKTRKVIKQIKPDVAIGFLEGGYGLYLSSFGLRVKKVSSFRVNPSIILNKKGLRAFIEKQWFRNSSKIVIQTESQREFLPKKLNEKSVVIENPVSEKALEESVEKYSDSVEKFTMLGRLNEQKNYEMSIKALKIVCEKHESVKLEIFGKGPSEEKIKNLICELGLENNVFLRGWTQSPLEELSKTDCYLMTSNFEGLPNALMEAMAIGLPCISTDCPTGPSDLIDDGKNGFLVPINDHEVLAQKMIEVIEMPKDERQLLGKTAKEKILLNFSALVICEKWESFLQALIKK